MKLQTKAVLAFNFFIIMVCVIMGVLGYISAAGGLEVALQRSARSNINAIVEIMNYHYAGDWRIDGGKLFKGDTEISGNNDIPDYLGKVCEGQVTFFLNDTRVATTVKDKSGNRSVGTKASEKIINEVLKGGNSYTGRAEVVGEWYDSAYTPIKNSAGQIIGMIFVGLPAKSLDDVVNNLVTSIILAMAIIIVVLGGLSWIVIGRQMKKLTHISDAMEEIARGNLAVQNLEVTSADEIGTLSKDVNEMKEKLRKLLRDVLKSCEQVAASSEELTASAEQTSESIKQVESSTIDMANLATRQSQTIIDLQETINDMGGKMGELYMEANQMNEASKTGRQFALDGKEKVDFAINQMHKIELRVKKSAEVVDALGNRSKEIGTIVDAISEIADQTNLLALNAAIEAARAGEHGRGFSVVAEEVRKLAEQSAVSAQNISELIQHIQNDTTSAVDEMNHSNAGVKEGSNSVIETGEAFKTIEDQINTLNENVQRAINHIDVVSEISLVILQAIESVQQISQKTAEDAQNVSALTEEQSATIHEMSQSSNQLSILAQKLQNEVNKFKV